MKNGTVNEADLEALCRQAAGGDADALARLMHLHHAALWGFARRKVGPEWQGKIDPEDLLQEAYVQACNGIAGFAYSGPDSFYHWFTRIIKNLFVDAARRWRAAKRDTSREVALSPGRGSSYANLLEKCLSVAGRTPGQEVQLDEAVGCLMRCIAQLPPDYRTVVQRVYLKEESFAAIAADMGRSEDALRRLAGRAVEKLQECLGRASRYFSKPP